VSDYVWRVHLMAPADQAAAGGRAAARVLPGGDAERAMFGAPLRDGAGGRDMRGCSTLLTDRQWRDLEQALAAERVGVAWVRLRACDDGLDGASDGLDADSGRRWTWDDTLAATGCAVMEVRDG
jgi:hypothetical protein